MKILLDMVTGVNYLYCRDGYSGGLTVMRNPDGSPIVTPPQMLFPNQTK
ncbi:MAG: xylan 1,4-beta-xylosidase [Oscillospiraceae bacterium]|nr:xylan 1,4-beta-xylosidase [Oscillospiraceae bacterium]